MQRLDMKDLIVNLDCFMGIEANPGIEYDQSTLKTCPIWNVPLNAEADRDSIPPFQKGQFPTNVSLFYLDL